MPDIPWGPGISFPSSSLDAKEFMKKVRELKELDAVMETIMRDLEPDKDRCRICGEVIGRKRKFYRDALDEQLRFRNNIDRWVHVDCFEKTLKVEVV